MHLEEIEWIDERNFPGGPLAHLFASQRGALNIAGDVLARIIPACADSLLVSATSYKHPPCKVLIHGKRFIGCILFGADGIWLLSLV